MSPLVAAPRHRRFLTPNPENQTLQITLMRCLELLRKGSLWRKWIHKDNRTRPLVNVELVARGATDEVLVAAAKSGDQLAFVELWTRHSNTAFKIAYQIMGNRDDAEDAIQDAWMKAYVHLKTFDGRAKFSTWLTRIAINSTLMTLRRRRTRRETSMEITDGDNRVQYEITDGKRSVEELCVQHETVEHLRLAIGRLQPTLRIVLEIHQSDDRPVKEVAELAGISVAATKSRLLRARKVLRG